MRRLIKADKNIVNTKSERGRMRERERWARERTRRSRCKMRTKEHLLSDFQAAHQV